MTATVVVIIEFSCEKHFITANWTLNGIAAILQGKMHF